MTPDQQKLADQLNEIGARTGKPRSAEHWAIVDSIKDPELQAWARYWVTEQ